MGRIKMSSAWLKKGATAMLLCVLLKRCEWGGNRRWGMRRLCRDGAGRGSSGGAPKPANSGRICQAGIPTFAFCRRER